MAIAAFSNGHRDEYKGHRPVTAGWMITEKETGEVIASGHSLDRAKAEKTARANIPLAAQLPSGWRTLKNSPACIKWVRKEGYRTPCAMERDYKFKNAEEARKYKIEIVDIEAAPYRDGDYEAWLNRVEALLGFDLDGSQYDDGYSLDYAFIAFREGQTPEDHASRVRSEIASLDAH